MRIRNLTKLLLGAVLALGLSIDDVKAEYPEKPITLVLPVVLVDLTTGTLVFSPVLFQPI